MLAKLKLTSQTDFDPGVETDEQLWSLIKKLVKIFSKHNDQKVSVEFSKLFFLIFIIADSLHETHICSQTPLPLMIIQLSGTTLELQLLLALQRWGLNNWTAVSAAWTMTVQLHFRRFTLFQQQKITFRSPSQTYNYSKTDKRIPSFYFSRLVLLPELFGYFFKNQIFGQFCWKGVNVLKL